jgi:hypothetical protein
MDPKLAWAVEIQTVRSDFPVHWRMKPRITLITLGVDDLERSLAT